MMDDNSTHPNQCVSRLRCPRSPAPGPQSLAPGPHLLCDDLSMRRIAVCLLFALTLSGRPPGPGKKPARAPATVPAAAPRLA